LILHHEKEVKTFQKLLVSGLCGYFIDLINNYETGISRNVTKWGFEIYLKEGEESGVESAQTKILENAQKIFDKISAHMKNEKTISIETNQNYFLKNKGMEIAISFGNFSKGSTSIEGQFNQRLTVTIFSDDYELIKSISNIVGIKYWLVEWVLLDPSIDILNLIQSIKETTGKNYSGSTGSIDGVITSKSIECTIIDAHSLKIWATLSGGINTPTSFRMRAISGDNVFENIFDYFNPDIILKIFYEELSQKEIKRIVFKSCGI